MASNFNNDAMARLLADVIRSDPQMMRLLTEFAQEKKDGRPSHIIQEEVEWDD